MRRLHLSSNLNGEKIKRFRLYRTFFKQFELHFTSDKNVNFARKNQEGLSTSNGRQTDKGAEAQVYGAHRGAEHEAGNHCAEVFVGTRVQVQAEPPAIAREARHRTSLVQDLHFCERMLLART